MISVDNHYYHGYTTIAIVTLLLYFGLAGYAYLVRDRGNFLVAFIMDMAGLLSISFKAQLLLCLIFVFAGTRFHHSEMDKMAAAMWISAILVFLFHGVQPRLRNWGARNGLT